MEVTRHNLIQRLRVSAKAFFTGNSSRISVEDLNSGSAPGMAIESLEPRIAPEMLIVNPPGGGNGTTVDLPDAADGGMSHAVANSPALELPTSPPPVLRI